MSWTSVYHCYTFGELLRLEGTRDKVVLTDLFTPQPLLKGLVVSKASYFHARGWKSHEQLFPRLTIKVQ